MPDAMRGLKAAHAAWERAGRPGSNGQLAFFPEYRFGSNEGVQGRKADSRIPRKRGRRASKKS